MFLESRLLAVYFHRLQSFCQTSLVKQICRNQEYKGKECKRYNVQYQRKHSRSVQAGIENIHQIGVRGEKKERDRTIPPNSSRGTNIPLMNIKGNLTRLESIMTLEGAFEDGEARRTPSDAKQRQPRITPTANITILNNIDNIGISSINNPAVKTKVVTREPKTIPATTSPSITVITFTGYESSLS